MAIERAKTQWFARHEAIGKILEAASKTFQDPEDKKNIEELFKNHESIMKIFSAIVENREKNKSTSDDAVISQEVEDRLISQLNIKVYETVLHGRELLESSREARASALRFAGEWTACSAYILNRCNNYKFPDDEPGPSQTASGGCATGLW